MRCCRGRRRDIVGMDPLPVALDEVLPEPLYDCALLCRACRGALLYQRQERPRFPRHFCWCRRCGRRYSFGEPPWSPSDSRSGGWNDPRSARLRTSAEAMTWPKPSVIAAARPDQCLPGSCLSARSTAAALAATAAREVPAGVAATEVGIEAEAAAGVRAAPVRVRQLDRKGARRLRAARCCRRALLTRAARMDAASAPIGEQADDDDRGGDQDPEGQHYRMLVCEIHAALFRATQGSSAHSRSSVPGVQPSAA